MPPLLSHRKRLAFVLIGLFLLFALLIVQFFKIQIIEGDKWKKQAKRQHQLIVVEPFKRGLFYSNTSMKLGHPETEQAFVIDVPRFHLYADPQNIPPAIRSIIAKRISSLVKKEDEESRVLSQLEKKSRSRKLAAWLESSEMQKIEEWWYPFAKTNRLPRNALFFVQDYKRCYPFGKLLGQVLHTVREDKDLQSRQPIPTGGLEFTFDRVLQGKEGRRQILRSPRHSIEAGKILSEPEDGADVYLTINHYLQAIAEEGISKAVKRSNAKSGWAILMEPRTGEIWALAQYPHFDPSRYKDYFNNPDQQEHTKVKAITDAFEPGSVMKPLTVALALLANQELKKQGKSPLFSPDEKIPTANGVFPGRKKPIGDMGRVFSYLNMDLAIQKSSNIYVARLVQRIVDRLGDKWYRDALEKVLGYGVKTGIELPSESPGAIPTPGKLHKNGTMEWSKPTPYSIAFGHNILVTSMQMLKSYGMLANGGWEVNPKLIRKVVRKKRDGVEEVLIDNTKDVCCEKGRRILDTEIVNTVVHAMKGVTKPGGGSIKGDIYGYTEAGKSGTAEKIVNGTYSKTKNICTFVGFSPAINPSFVLLIAVDEPEYKYIPGVGKNQLASNCCAPAFADIGLKALQYLGVAPDDPYGYPAGDPRRDETKADFLPEVKALKELYEKWNGSPKS